MQRACFRALSNYTAHKACFRYDTAHEAVLVVSCRGGQFAAVSCLCSSFTLPKSYFAEPVHYMMLHQYKLLLMQQISYMLTAYCSVFQNSSHWSHTIALMHQLFKGLYHKCTFNTFRVRYQIKNKSTVVHNEMIAQQYHSILH